MIDKNQEYSAHCFGDNYLMNHLVKFYKIGLNPEELELLQYAQYELFLKKIVREGFLTSFNFLRGSC